MNRPLSPLEHVVWLIDRAIQQNFTMVVRLKETSGDFTAFERILREALDMLQEKYPPLKCRIKEGEVPEFVAEGTPRIPLKVLERKGDDHWIDEVEKEMIEPLPWTKGPLIRVVLLKSIEKCDLLVTFCHVVADATSGVTFIRNLLNISDKLFRGEEVEVGPLLSPLPASDQLLRDDLKVGIEAPQADSIQETYQPVELLGNKDFPPDKRITRVLQRFLSVHETKKLVLRSKEENTSVHGVICAAFLQAIVDDIRKTQGFPPKKPLMIGCVTPINIRHHFSRSVEGELGDFISQAIHYQLIDDCDSIWNTARKIKESLEDEIKLRNDIKGLLTIGDLLKTFVTSFHLARELNDLSAPVAVTNMGRLDIPEQFGNLILEEFHFTVGINADAKSGLGISITTFRGRLTLNFLYADPFLLKERALQLVENTMKRLKDALL